MSVAFEVHSMTSNACEAVVLLNKIRLIKIIDIYLMGCKREFRRLFSKLHQGVKCEINRNKLGYIFVTCYNSLFQ